MDTVQLIQRSTTLTMYRTIPQIGIVGFLVVFALSRLSTKPLTETKIVDLTSPVKNEPSTPQRAKMSPALGTVFSPVGRRSARIASRKED